jgi:hypothetical protein
MRKNCEIYCSLFYLPVYASGSLIVFDRSKRSYYLFFKFSISDLIFLVFVIDFQILTV